MNFDNLAIGVDTEEIDRFKSYSDRNDPFVKKVFTEKEADYCYSKKIFYQHLAARFCAKEALIKAVSSLLGKQYFYLDFEILNYDSGEPYVVFCNEELKQLKVKISLSHSKINATASVAVFLGE
ncbi:MAG: holo-ACP synthase [Candidatus Gastranaerophilales bacterium]|nr:holo-ACP synthase [Candidatus Gastranaerophilales bacterium]